MVLGAGVIVGFFVATLVCPAFLPADVWGFTLGYEMVASGGLTLVAGTALLADGSNSQP